MMVPSRDRATIGVVFAVLFVVSAVFGISKRSSAQTAIVEEKTAGTLDAAIRANAAHIAEEGTKIFRFDTFGDEDFWGDTLQLHKAIEGTKLRGVGQGVSPRTALAVGLKVDIDALPESLVMLNRK
jgi:hypothetical protein